MTDETGYSVPRIYSPSNNSQLTSELRNSREEHCHVHKGISTINFRYRNDESVIFTRLKAHSRVESLGIKHF